MRNLSFRRRYSRGFTLMELIVTMAVVAIVAGIAVPNMRDFVRNSRLTGSANELLRALQTARTEAMRGQRHVVMCGSNAAASAAATCSLTGVNGWIVFQDTNGNWDRDTGEALVFGRTFESDKIFFRMDGSMRVSFAPTGYGRPAGSVAATQTPSRRVVMCDQRGNVADAGGSTARGLLISDVGRARVTRNKTDIDTLLTAMNATCP